MPLPRKCLLKAPPLSSVTDSQVTRIKPRRFWSFRLQFHTKIFLCKISVQATIQLFFLKMHKKRFIRETPKDNDVQHPKAPKGLFVYQHAITRISSKKNSCHEFFSHFLARLQQLCIDHEVNKNSVKKSELRGESLFSHWTRLYQTIEKFSIKGVSR